MKDSRMRRIVVPVVVAMIVSALLAIIAIPNMLVALDRSRQRRSMADMRSIATALEARAVDRKSYAIGSASAPTATDFRLLTRVPMDEVERALVPVYLRTLVRRDGWGNELEVRVSAKSYAIRSLGSDGRPDANIRFNHVTTSFEEDIVFSDGNFIQYPEGT